MNLKYVLLTSVFGARLTSVICNNKKELCICGDPTILSPYNSQ